MLDDSNCEKAASLRDKIPLEGLRTGRVGLVLCGGGFKGAYQIGVWKWLSELGITRLRTIAGTSVGALNAILIANGDFQSAQDIWINKNFLRWFPQSIRVYFRAYALLLGPYIVSFLTLLVAVASSTAPILAASSAELYKPSIREIVLWTATVPFFTSAAIVGTAISIRENRTFLFLPSGLFGFVSAVLGFLAFGTVMECLSYSVWTCGFASVACTGLGVGIGLYCCNDGFDSLHQAYSTASLFSNAEVLSELKSRVNLEAMRSRVESVLVTIAAGKTFFDPLTNSLRPIPASAQERPGARHSLRFERDPNTPGSRKAWVPVYRNLSEDGVSSEEALEVLRLTSAIPFVFSIGLTVAEEVVVDGGLADNMPILPLLLMQLDYIIVVALDENAPRTISKLQKCVTTTWEQSWPAWIEADRVLEIFKTRMNGGDYESHIPRCPQIRSGQVIMVIPEKPLPTCNVPFLRFLTGTLNLRRETRQRWLTQGYEESKNLQNLHVLT